jgi:hypothetical protein
VLLVVVLGIFGFFALVRGAGSDSATGNVLSISTVPTGKVVCVRDAKSRRTLCGEVSQPDVSEKLGSVTVHGCAYIKVARGAALKIEHRTC